MINNTAEQLVSRACRYFRENEGKAFGMGYMHGLSYCLDYDKEYQTIQMLAGYWLGKVNMEGETCTLNVSVQ